MFETHDQVDYPVWLATYWFPFLAHLIDEPIELCDDESGLCPNDNPHMKVNDEWNVDILATLQIWIGIHDLVTFTFDSAFATLSNERLEKIALRIVNMVIATVDAIPTASLVLPAPGDRS